MQLFSEVRRPMTPERRGRIDAIKVEMAATEALFFHSGPAVDFDGIRMLWTLMDDLERDEDKGKDPEDQAPATDDVTVPAPGETPDDDANLAADPPLDAVTES